jgi:hypothetical protein
MPEDPAIYHDHRDDPEEWDDDNAVQAPARRLSTVVSVRLDAEEEARLREAAKARGETLSGFIRNAALRVARGVEPRRQIAPQSRSVPAPLVVAEASPARYVVSPTVVGPGIDARGTTVTR